MSLTVSNNDSIKALAKLNVFGSKPKDSIFNPKNALGVRLNCQAGQVALSEDEYLGNSMEISILGVNEMYGSLGKTRDAEWLQIFFIPAPSCKFLPSNTVCVSYIKTRSLTQFSQIITRLMENGEPAEGIFLISFDSHSNEKGQSYKSVKFGWKERKTAEEKKQLNMIIGFMQTSPILADSNGTREMYPINSVPVLRADDQPVLIAA